MHGLSINSYGFNWVLSGSICRAPGAVWECYVLQWQEQQKLIRILSGRLGKIYLDYSPTFSGYPYVTYHNFHVSNWLEGT